MDPVPFPPSVLAVTGGTIVGTTLCGCTILSSTLSGNTLVNSTLSGGTYIGGTSSGITLINATISGGTHVGGTFSGSTLISATLSGAVSIGGSISGSTITTAGGALSGTTLNAPVGSGGTWVGGTFSGTTLNAPIGSGGTWVAGVFSGTTLNAPVGSGGTWVGGTFSGTTLINPAVSGTFLQSGSGTFGTGTGVATINCTTEASAVGTAGTVVIGGLGVAKRSYLGTIGSTFKGNVLAGVQDATAAVAGQVGEVLISTVASAAVGADNVTANITSVSITAGDWIISGLGVFYSGLTGFRVNNTLFLSITSTTGGVGTSGSSLCQQVVPALIAGAEWGLSVPAVHVNVSSTTTYYLTASVPYAAGTPVADATILARRIR